MAKFNSAWLIHNPGRSPDRPEEQDHTALGETGNAPFGSQGSADPLGLYLRRYLPGQGRRCGLGATQMQYRRHEPSSAGNIRCRHTRSPCHRHRRSGRVALLKNPGDTGQHHPAALAAEIAGTQPGRKHLAVHAR